MLDRTAAGRSTPPTLNEVEGGAVRRFAESLGDANPIWLDHDQARAAGFRGVVAPPSFPVTFNPAVDYRELIGAAGRTLLLADFTIEYERPLIVGDRLLVSSRVSELTERPGPAGRVDVAVIDDEGRDEQGGLVYRARRSFVVRAAKEA
jgi:acyl dehydratase